MEGSDLDEVVTRRGTVSCDDCMADTPGFIVQLSSLPFELCDKCAVLLVDRLQKALDTNLTDDDLGRVRASLGGSLDAPTRKRA